MLEELMSEVEDFDIPIADSTLLVVDDEAVVRDVLTSMFEAQGFVMREAENGTQALEVLAEARPRAVLLDKNLPDISGLEVLREGRNIVPDAEFLIITGYASVETAQEAMDLGAFGYLLKPFRDVRTVSNRVKAALEKNRISRQNELLLARLRETTAESVSRAEQLHKKQMGNEAGLSAMVALLDSAVLDAEALRHSVRAAANDPDSLVLATPRIESVVQTLGLLRKRLDALLDRPRED